MIRTIVLALVLLFSLQLNAQEQKEAEYGVFSFSKELVLPGKPEIIFDAATGDISGWWDHSFSKDPLKFYIEPMPGGAFMEIFDEAGNGVKHASVIVADRGKLLRFEGPLGLSGLAVNLVCTYEFKAQGADSTLMKLSVHGAGELSPSHPKAIEQVWEHFLFEQFKTYVLEEKHLENAD